MSLVGYAVPTECQPYFQSLHHIGRNDLVLSSNEREKIFNNEVFSESLSDISLNRIFVNSIWGHDFSPSRHGVDSRGYLVWLAKAPRTTPYIYFSVESLKQLIADFDAKKNVEFQAHELNAFIDDLFKVIKTNHSLKCSLLFEPHFPLQEYE